MLCFMCLTEDRTDPGKAVTYVQGTTVCREHVAVLRENGQRNLVGIAAAGNNGNNGGDMADQIRRMPLEEQMKLLDRVSTMFGGGKR